MDGSFDLIFFACSYDYFYLLLCAISISSVKMEAEDAFEKSWIELLMVFATFILCFGFGIIESKIAGGVAVGVLFCSFNLLLVN